MRGYAIAITQARNCNGLHEEVKLEIRKNDQSLGVLLKAELKEFSAILSVRNGRRSESRIAVSFPAWALCKYGWHPPR